MYAYLWKQRTIFFFLYNTWWLVVVVRAILAGNPSFPGNFFREYVCREWKNPRYFQLNCYGFNSRRSARCSFWLENGRSLSNTQVQVMTDDPAFYFRNEFLEKSLRQLRRYLSIILSLLKVITYHGPITY